MRGHGFTLGDLEQQTYVQQLDMTANSKPRDRAGRQAKAYAQLLLAERAMLEHFPVELADTASSQVPSAPLLKILNAPGSMPGSSTDRIMAVPLAPMPSFNPYRCPSPARAPLTPLTHGPRVPKALTYFLSMVAPYCVSWQWGAVAWLGFAFLVGIVYLGRHPQLIIRYTSVCLTWVPCLLWSAVIQSSILLEEAHGTQSGPLPVYGPDLPNVQQAYYNQVPPTPPPDLILPTFVCVACYLLFQRKPA